MPNSSYKSYSKFVFREALNPSETNKFSHSTIKMRKMPELFEDTSKQKFLYDWFVKRISIFFPDNDINVSLRKALLEVIAQEFLRIFHRSQPKTRIVILTDAIFGNIVAVFVASQAIIDYKRLSSADETKITSHSYTGLAKLLILALSVNEIDLKDDNLGKAISEILKIDGNCCFWHLQETLKIQEPSNDYNDSFTAEDYVNLPWLGQYKPHNWAGIILEKQTTETQSSAFFTKKIKENKKFLQEKFETTLMRLLFSKELTTTFVKYYIPDMELGGFANIIIQELEAKKNMLHNAAIGDHLFLDYIRHLNDDDFLNKYTQFLKQFVATNKNKIFNKPTLDKHLIEQLSLLKERFKHIPVNLTVEPKKENHPSKKRKTNRFKDYTLKEIHETILNNQNYLEIFDANESTLNNYLKACGLTCRKLRNTPSKNVPFTNFKDIYDKKISDIYAAHQTHKAKEPIKKKIKTDPTLPKVTLSKQEVKPTATETIETPTILELNEEKVFCGPQVKDFSYTSSFTLFNSNKPEPFPFCPPTSPNASLTDKQLLDLEIESWGKLNF